MSIVKIFSVFFQLVLDLLNVAGIAAEAVHDRRHEIGAATKRSVDFMVDATDSISILGGKATREIQKGLHVQGYDRRANLDKILDYSEAVKNSEKNLKKDLKNLKKATTLDNQKIKDTKDQLKSLKSYGLHNYKWD